MWGKYVTGMRNHSDRTFLRLCWASLFDVFLCVRQQTPSKLWDKSCNEVRILGRLLKCLSHEVNTLLLQQKSSTSVRQSFIKKIWNHQMNPVRPSPTGPHLFKHPFVEERKKPNICIHIIMYIYIFMVNVWIWNHLNIFFQSKHGSLTTLMILFVQHECLSPKITSENETIFNVFQVLFHVFLKSFQGARRPQLLQSTGWHGLRHHRSPNSGGSHCACLISCCEKMDEQISFVPDKKSVMVQDLLLP